MYFSSLADICEFTFNLKVTGHDLVCEACGAVGQFVSHGFTHKSELQLNDTCTGKRLICSSRYGKNGCGVTLRLVACQVAVQLKYGLACVQLFLAAWIQGMSVSKAYHEATHACNPRQAWRWLRRLRGKSGEFRGFLCQNQQAFKAEGASDRGANSVLMATVKHLMDHLGGTSPLAYYQQLSQRGVIH